MVHFFPAKALIYSVAPPDGGCGCGFLGPAGAYDDQGEYVEDGIPGSKEARSGLADLLSVALRHQQEVEVLVCCSGDEGYPPAHRLRARPMDFTRDDRLFQPIGMLIVVSEQDC